MLQKCATISIMKNLDFLIKKPIAHRGLRSANCPENSVCAFARALKHDLPIEFDVHLTSDGELVVFHDWNTQRLTGEKGIVEKMTLKELRSLHLGGTKEKIPTFKEVLNLIDSKVPIVIEIKTKKIKVDKICNEIVKNLRNYRGMFAINSFNPFVIKWFGKHQPSIVRGQNFSDFPKDWQIASFIKKILLYLFWIINNSSQNFFVIRVGLLPRSFPSWMALRRKKPILIYGVGNKDEYDRIKDAVDNEFVDYLDSGSSPE